MDIQTHKQKIEEQRKELCWMYAEALTDAFGDLTHFNASYMPNEKRQQAITLMADVVSKLLLLPN